MRNRGQAGSNGGYSQVQHNLDEEEIEFKRMFETQSDNIDDIFGEGDTDSEMVFDSKDLDRLNMLEKYRDSLIAGAETTDTADNIDDHNTPLKGGSDVEENEEIADENDHNTPLKAGAENNDSQI
eukprot:CAMPEP_0119043214 /NCGR_PEP_ID=MMETSP1177-20130426/19491_1 /TAXON_ID=2985 /ORGANISM="Ochromonas sp, Strain CCMP1899" /LENGTH=124 /DNA_ID=CAMNT_0007010871 /DNA_START=96 /DNA_END=470 /DNA_ORIENTATION=+